jgi:hypothetical protein
VKQGKEMSINKRVLHALGDPQYIHFWWCEANRILLIGGAPEESLLTFKISDRYYNTKTGFKIGNSIFIKRIMNITGWHGDAIYTVIGKYISQLNMVSFNLNNAVELELELGAEVETDE